MDITLVCIDSQRKEKSKAVIEEMTRIFPCKRSLFFSHEIESDLVEVIDIGIIKGKVYTDFVLKELHKYIDTEHVLIVQYDGYILNPHLWQDEFLNWDYIGAPWSIEQTKIHGGTMDNVVGNGGFSLRTKKFLQVASEVFKEQPITINCEDILCCIEYYDLFVERGIRFAPIELAFQFSIEDVFPEEFVPDSPYKFKKPFGYHRHLYNIYDRMDQFEYFDLLIDKR